MEDKQKIINEMLTHDLTFNALANYLGLTYKQVYYLLHNDSAKMDYNVYSKIMHFLHIKGGNSDLDKLQIMMKIECIEQQLNEIKNLLNY